MPDRYGFDHLGADVRCIDCPQGGPRWAWPKERRQRHAHSHQHTPQAGTDELRRRRTLTAPPITPTSEEKETAAMPATRKPREAESAKEVAIDILRTAGLPLHAKEIAKRVIESGRARLKGKTPEATISAMLAVGAKPGGPFNRTDKATYTLTDTTIPSPNPSESAVAPTPVARRSKRQTSRATS